ncbi:MAG TPA: phasin family protein [Stellaceae bacterium]|nr:phasin family protein [Stellaceae bacterium]
MAKAQAEETRAKRDSEQVTVLFDPSQALSRLEPLLNAGNKWLESLAALSSELIEFSRAGLDRSIEASKAIARSASIDEAMDLQADYTRMTVRACFDEAGKLADLGTRALLESLTAWQPARSGETPQRRDAA